MKIIYKPRQSGKTLEAIKISAETGSRIVCHSKEECNRVFCMAQEMGINIPFPISFDEFLRREYHGRHIKGFIIDNADMLLQYLTPVMVECVTLSKN